MSVRRDDDTGQAVARRSVRDHSHERTRRAAERASALAPCVVITGPTAIGKSSLALRLAEEAGAEIVSMDSAQVYRGMDIGTAKPDAAERGRVPHHGLDLCEPEETFDAERFARLVADLRARPGGPPLVVVGGTHLYLRAWLLGLDPMPEVPADVREAFERRLVTEGLPALRAQLEHVDPVTAARLEPGDTQRTLRALALWHVSGRPASALQQGARRLAEGAFDANLSVLALWPDDREALRERIARRFHAMLEQGFEAEVDRLIARPDLTAAHPSQRAVGYRQYRAWREGLAGGADSRAGFIAQAITATRQYAKRQLTWLRNDPLPPLFASAGAAATRSASLPAMAAPGHAVWPIASSKARRAAEETWLRLLLPRLRFVPPPAS